MFLKVVLGSIDHGGKSYVKGDSFEIADSEAQRLLSLGVAAPVEGPDMSEPVADISHFVAVEEPDEVSDIVSFDEEAAPTLLDQINELPGVQPQAIISLQDEGLITAEAITSVSASDLCKLKGIGKNTALKILDLCEKILTDELA